MAFSSEEERVLKALASGLLGAAKGNGGGGGQSAGGGSVAEDPDLDGQWGDEEIKRDPSAKYWDGEPMKGSRMSQCAPEYLDAFAKYKEACAYMSAKEPDEQKQKYAGYDRKSAARARGWAARIRARGPSTGGGTKQLPPKSPADTGTSSFDDYGGASGGDDEIPFALNMTLARTHRP